MRLGDPTVPRVHGTTLAALALALALPSTAIADRAQEEIAYLLNAVGQSGCTFIRNGTEHSATDAEAHLRLKYGKGKRYAKTADQFIQYLASQSSWTRQAYLIECPDMPTEPSGQWLSKRLEGYRSRHEQFAPSRTANGAD